MKLDALCLPGLELLILLNLSIRLMVGDRSRTFAMRCGAKGGASGGLEVEGGAVGDDLLGT